MAIRLIIKGTPDDARAAARERAIAITEVHRSMSQDGFTVAKAANRFAKPVWDWYHSRTMQPRVTGKEKGYPPGTLVVYRER